MLHEPRLERLRNRLSDLILERKDVPKLTLIGLRPEVVSVRRVDQLRNDPNPIAVAPHASLQDRGDVEIVADLPDVQALPLEGEGRGTRYHAQAIEVGQ